MIKTILLFLIFLGATWLGHGVIQDPGYLFVEYNNYILESPLWLACVLVLVMFVFIHFFINFFNSIKDFFYAIPEWWRSIRLKRSLHTTQVGLLALNEGNWHKAEKKLVSKVALDNSEFSGLNYLAAAQSAQAQGKIDLRDKYLMLANEEIMKIDPKSISVELMRAKMEVESMQIELALDTLKSLILKQPKHPVVLDLLQNVYQKLNMWDELIILMPLLKNLNILDEIYRNNILIKAHLNVMNRFAENIDMFIQYWDSLPRTLKNNPIITTSYCNTLLKYNRNKQVYNIASKVLKSSLHEPLVLLLGKFFLTDINTQIKYVEKLANKYFNSYAIYLTLARLYSNNKLWGQAKSSYEKSIELNPNTHSYLELAVLCEQLGKSSAAKKNYSLGLTHAAGLKINDDNKLIL